MHTFHLDSAWTLAAAVATILLGMRLHRAWPALERANIPPSVSAGLLLSVLLTLLRAGGVADVRLAPEPRGVLLLVFFASAIVMPHMYHMTFTENLNPRAIVSASWGLPLLLLLGLLLARAFGQPAALGLFVGSAAYIGGHGTATAWASAVPVAGALEVGLGGATLGLVLGSLLAGPVAAWLMRGQAGATHPTPATQAGGQDTLPDAHDAAAPVRGAPFSSDRWLPPLLGLLVCVAAGPGLTAWLGHAAGWQVPTFLVVLLAAVALTNGADLLRRPFDTQASDLVGTVALRVFLAMAMLTLDWAELAEHLPLLLSGALVQAAITSAIGIGLVYVLLRARARRRGGLRRLHRLRHRGHADRPGGDAAAANRLRRCAARHAGVYAGGFTVSRNGQRAGHCHTAALARRGRLTTRRTPRHGGAAITLLRARRAPPPSARR